MQQTGSPHQDAALFMTVTKVRTGLPRVIANDAISIDRLLASACLPELFQADGGGRRGLLGRRLLR